MQQLTLFTQKLKRNRINKVKCDVQIGGYWEYWSGLLVRLCSRSKFWSKFIGQNGFGSRLRDKRKLWSGFGTILRGWCRHWTALRDWSHLGTLDGDRSILCGGSHLDRGPRHGSGHLGRRFRRCSGHLGRGLRCGSGHHGTKLWKGSHLGTRFWKAAILGQDSGKQPS